MTQEIKKQVEDFLKKELPLITSIFLRKIEVGDNEPLQDVYETEDIVDMLDKYFQTFEVEHQLFTWADYFPWQKKTLFLDKKTGKNKKPLTISMLVQAAEIKRWLY